MPLISYAIRGASPVRFLVICAACVFPVSLSAEEIDTHLLIVGATESGWAAAIQAARSGVESITIVHDGEWYGVT